MDSEEVGEAVVDGEAVSPEATPETESVDAEGQQSQEELREKLEEEIRQVKVEDLILQSTVSILNLAARRIAKDDERDLEQGKMGIDATRSLLEHLPEEARERVQEALSELQMLYAKEAAGTGKQDIPDNP